jgi:hypothetical protein
MTDNGSRLWHYTRLMALPSILLDGELKPRRAGWWPIYAERPVVWLSTNSDAERSVTHRKAARIEVRPTVAAGPWAEYAARIPGDLAACITDGQNPEEWRISYKAVTREDWLTVEVHVDGIWVDLDSSAASAVYRRVERAMARLKSKSPELIALHKELRALWAERQRASDLALAGATGRG